MSVYDVMKQMQTEVRKCIRCRETYYEINNIGRWQCRQTAFPHIRYTASEVLVDTPYNNATRFFVGADHTDDPDCLVYTHDDDILMSSEFLMFMPQEQINLRSLIPREMFFRESEASMHISILAPKTVGCATAIRRFDYLAAKDAYLCDDLRHGFEGKLSKDHPRLIAEPFLTFFSGGGTMLTLRPELYQEDVINKRATAAYARTTHFGGTGLGPRR